LVCVHYVIHFSCFVCSEKKKKVTKQKAISQEKINVKR
jgi:hypothetical protein